MIIDPTGELCSEPLVGDEGIVYADIDIADSIEPKQAHDIIGYYQRFDLFSLRLDQRPQVPIELVSGPAGEPPAHDDEELSTGVERAESR